MERTHLEDLLGSLVRSEGATLHLIANQTPCMRVQDSLIACDAASTSAEDIGDLARDFLFADHRAQLESGEEVEIVYTSTDGMRFRTTVIPQVEGWSMVFRRVPSQIPTFGDLELPELLGSFVGFRSGLILLTGFMGSGKSSTLASMVERINNERPVHIVCVEDSIEFIHQSKVALIHQREVGTHIETVAEGVSHAYHQGAEVIAVNTLSDYEGFLSVLDAVERGSLVLCAFSASGVVAGTADLFRMIPAAERSRVRYRFAQALRVMMSQTLIKRRHGNSRVPLLEIMIRNKAVSRAIRHGTLEDLNDIMVRGRGLGMQTTDMALRSLLNRHLITAEEAAYHAADRDWVCSRVAMTPA